MLSTVLLTTAAVIKGEASKPRMNTPPVVRKLRVERGLTQEELAVRLQLLGLDLNRAGLSKIPVITQALKVEISDLYPPGALRKRQGQRRSR